MVIATSTEQAGEPATEEAVLKEFPPGVRGQGLKQIIDNGCQLSSRFFLKVTATLNIEWHLISYNNPKGNSEGERFMRTLTAGLLWLKEFAGLDGAHVGTIGLRSSSITTGTCTLPWAI